MLKLCSVSSQSLSAKEKRTHEAQANKVSGQNVRQVQVQTPPSHRSSRGLHLSALKQPGIPAKSAAPRNLFQLPLTRLLTFWGAPNSYQRWSTCLGGNIVCLLWMRALIKNKAKQNKNVPCTAHLFQRGDLLEEENAAW